MTSDDNKECSLEAYIVMNLRYDLVKAQIHCKDLLKMYISLMSEDKALAQQIYHS